MAFITISYSSTRGVSQVLLRCDHSSTSPSFDFIGSYVCEKQHITCPTTQLLYTYIASYYFVHMHVVISIYTYAVCD